MDTFLELLKHGFTWGLLLGLLIAGFLWKGGYQTRRVLQKELKRIEGEMRDLQVHLNTQLKINASGNEALQNELADLRSQNETLRVNLAAVQTKPGRAELRQLQAFQTAIRKMQEQAPGFAPAWESALRQAESELEDADRGLRKLFHKVLPGLNNGPAIGQLTHSERENAESRP